MPPSLLNDPLLQKIAPLPIPEAVKMLEQVSPDNKRHGFAVWLAQFWYGGVSDVRAACLCITNSDLDDPCKEILIQGLMRGN